MWTKKKAPYRNPYAEHSTVTTASACETRELLTVQVAAIREVEGFNARGASAEWKSSREYRELLASVRLHGVLEPLIVRRDGELFTVIAGHRRLEAARDAGIELLPCVVAKDDDDAETLSLLENIVRQDLPPVAEVSGVSRLADGTSATAVAKSLGKSLAWVSKRIRVAKALAEGKVTEADLATAGVDATYESLSKDGVGRPKKKKEEKKAKTEAQDGGSEDGKKPGVEWTVIYDGDVEGAVPAIKGVTPGTRVRILIEA